MDHKFKFFSSMIFSRKVMGTIFGKQEFTLPEAINGIYIPRNHQFQLSDSYRDEWNNLLTTRHHRGVLPYSYYWPWMMDYTMKNLLPDLGIALKNVLHLGHEARIGEDFESIRQNMSVLKNRLVDLCALSKNKIVLVTETAIEDEKGKVLYLARDFTVILNMKSHEMDMLKNTPVWDHEEVPFRTESFRTRASQFRDDRNARRKSFYCNADLANRFGSVAGALSVTHASVLTAKIFRQGKVFLQGMCTANIVLKILCDELSEDVSNFSIYFTNQLPFPQRIEVRFDDTVFEVFDESNTMVAYGQRVNRHVAAASVIRKKAA